MLDVIGVGFGRTGTLSLKAALEQLGFGPCHHMLGLLDRPGEIPLWEEAAAGRADWEKVYDGYRSSVDWPGAAFWRELVARNPESKVILTVRDPASWYRSAHGSIYRSVTAPDDGRDPVFTRLRALSLDIVWNGVFGGGFADRDHAVTVFERHIEEVRREVPAGRLLEFHVGQGWEPLCGFLGVPVPGGDFPHHNDGAQFAATLEQRKEH